MKTMPLGATPGEAGCHFRLWAPRARRVALLLEPQGRLVAMECTGGGIFETLVADARPGALYRYRLDDGEPMPDPRSRFQPQGVHGPSQVIDLNDPAWHDDAWQGVPQTSWVLYELHVGTFSPQGSFAGVRERLPYLRDLGINAVELMPIADFPGRWNWGYDPAAFFAPSRAYGHPDELCHLVDAAHACGIAMVLDVVYNHFGPDGAYAPAFAPPFLTERHKTAWGPAVNLDGSDAKQVRAFFIDNALMWLSDYRFDGLRLDAVHALQDESPVHFLAELSERCHALPGPRRVLIGEDSRNLSALVRSPRRGGMGLDGLWADDFHHQVRCTLTGESQGYFADYPGHAGTVGRIMADGWLYKGQVSPHLGHPRGTDPSDVAAHQLVFCIQNHDQVGNRARGDRLHHAVSPAQYRVASTLLLFAPQMPMLFAGQEWATGAPFQYFSDHAADLGKMVTQGRKAEFKHFREFAGEVPDPQDATTFARSCLPWHELEEPEHARVAQLYRDLIAWRRQLCGSVQCLYADSHQVVVQRDKHVLAATMQGTGSVPLPADSRLIWHSESSVYGGEAAPVLRETELHFFGPAAALLQVGP